HFAVQSSWPRYPRERTFSYDGDARLLRYTIRLLGARMTQARSAGIGALLLIVAPVSASVQTGLAVSRHRDGGCGIGVAFGGGCLRFRQAYRSFRGKSEAW